MKMYNSLNLNVLMENLAMTNALASFITWYCYAEVVRIYQSLCMLLYTISNTKTKEIIWCSDR